MKHDNKLRRLVSTSFHSLCSCWERKEHDKQDYSIEVNCVYIYIMWDGMAGIIKCVEVDISRY